jgi:hypothetical protein
MIRYDSRNFPRFSSRPPEEPSMRQIPSRAAASSAALTILLAATLVAGCRQRHGDSEAASVDAQGAGPRDFFALLLPDEPQSPTNLVCWFQCVGADCRPAGYRELGDVAAMRVSSPDTLRRFLADLKQATSVDWGQDPNQALTIQEIKSQMFPDPNRCAQPAAPTAPPAEIQNGAP